jgi:predicted CoA-binding protein
MGASPNTARYSNMAVKKLLAYNHPVEAIGLRENKIDNVQIRTGFPALQDINTVTMYLSAKNQESYYDYILSLKPERVIFNPGAENPVFEKKLQEKGIEPVEACTLVMLSTGQF